MQQPGKLLSTLAALILLLPALALAKPEVALTITAEKDIVVEENGQKVTKRIPADEVTPGETVIYTIHYQNSGNEAAADVTIVDPIPERTVFIAGSASKTGELTFSIDGGKTYQPATLLIYEVNLPDGTKQQRIATPDQYTHVRWIIPAIAAGETGSISFQVRTQ